MMADFHVIDLASQSHAVAAYIRGWSLPHVLTWLAGYGEVTQSVHPRDDGLYLFRSPTGLTTGFRLTRDGKLVILGQHTTSIN